MQLLNNSSKHYYVIIRVDIDDNLNKNQQQQ